MPTMTLVAGSDLSGKLPSYSCRLSLETSPMALWKNASMEFLLKEKKNNEMAPFLPAHVHGCFSYLYTSVRVLS